MAAGNVTAENVSLENVSAPAGALPDDHQMGLVVLFSLTTFLSIVGNCFVVLVFARGRRSRTDLRPFLINLAIADLLMAVFCMPFTFIYTMLQTWIFSTPMCPVVLFVQLMSVLGSVFTNTAIGIDRFLVVTFPLKSRLTKQKAKYVIVVIWLSSFAISSVQFQVAHTVAIPGGAVVCEEGWPSLAARKAYTVCIFIITYCIPLAILSITYSIVGVLLWKRTTPGNRDQARDLQQLRSKRKVVKMLVIVVAIFGVCWLPLHLFTLLLDFSSIGNRVDMELLTSIFISCHWLAMSNSFANPIIYSFTNESFRADLVTLLYMWFPCCVCLTKILPRHSSGSTYETVVFRRQSLYKQEAKISGSYHLRTVHGVRANKPYLNGETIHTKRNRPNYETMCGNDRSRLDRGTNGVPVTSHVITEGAREYVRLTPIYGRETSVSGDSSACADVSEGTTSNNS